MSRTSAVFVSPRLSSKPRAATLQRILLSHREALNRKSSPSGERRFFLSADAEGRGTRRAEAWAETEAALVPPPLIPPLAVALKSHLRAIPHVKTRRRGKIDETRYASALR